jgi:arsenate reductase
MALKILVICTGNSCRSIMGEALLNALGSGKVAACSAGSAPAGAVNPEAVRALRRHGIDPGDPRSKSWDEFAGQQFDYVITVCDNAAGETCPYFAGAPRRIHWSIPDPANATGSEEQIAHAFDHAFMLLHRNIAELLNDRL